MRLLSFLLTSLLVKRLRLELPKSALLFSDLRDVLLLLMLLLEAVYRFSFLFDGGNALRAKEEVVVVVDVLEAFVVVGIEEDR